MQMYGIVLISRYERDAFAVGGDISAVDDRVEALGSAVRVGHSCQVLQPRRRRQFDACVLLYALRFRVIRRDLIQTRWCLLQMDVVVF